ncbi:MAG: tRNA (guanosine(46)-N7)-methyltransferase TrmB [Bacteroidales bacterium]|jgi:tRNA (guanine-N7-)-methyltransferase|nr:tRNA (guanosine(46)-N7)-methyltransferase TrmB [Bacteroidales bacterium]
MVKNKLQRFAENKFFNNMFQCTYNDLLTTGFDLKGKWRSEFFNNENPIVLELGCGKGEYTIGLGKKYPYKNFIGLDIKGARMWRGCKTSNEENMTNVAFIRTHIQLIEHFFAANEVDEIWITFPDPQLKKPNKRLTSPRFLALYSKILKPESIIHLKTDSNDLYDYTLNEVLLPQKYNVIFHTNDLYAEKDYLEVKEIQTFYEIMYLATGKPITYIEFKIII